MSEEKQSTESSSENIVENNYMYVSPEGEVVLKKTSLFDERTLVTVDPDSVTDQVKAFESAFENVESTVDNFFDEWSEKAKENREEAKTAFEKLKGEILSVDAIGDFEALVKKADERFEEMVQEEEPADDTVSDKEEESGESEESDESDSKEYYESLVETAEQLMEMTDWAYVSMELDNIDQKWGEGPDPEDIDIAPLRKKIDELRESFEAKKKAHYEEKKQQREKNLEKKKDLLKKLKEIVDEEKWTHTKEVGKIKGQWDRVKSVPADEAESLEKRFSDLLKTFDDHKVDRMVKRMQQEEDNLTGKLVILEKMESFTSGLDEKSDWQELEKEFENLSKQFRKIGKVPSEKNQAVWERYHSAQDTFHSMRFKFDKAYRNEIEKFLSKKKKLIDEAEALIDADDLAQAARDVNKLHRRWKKVGNLPQKDENEMWNRFKAATDAFNDKKTDSLDELRDQEQENLNEKMELIKKAEELSDSEEWESTHQQLQNLMNKWKEVGPVPKRKSGKIWKQFKGAMDRFYDRRRDHFKEVKEERKDNLKEKEEVLKQLSELKDHESPIEAVELAKPLQEEFKKAGYVPIKHKNRLWKEYREVCDVIYERFRAAKAAVDVVGKENIDNLTKDDIADIRKLKSETAKLSKQISSLKSELIQKKESLSYFKPSRNSNPLLDEVKKKIQDAEDEIVKKEERLGELEKEIDMITKETE